MTSHDTLYRNLNDYESMLASMTCNVGMSLSIPRQECGHDDIENCLRHAWSKTVEERCLLQVKIIPIKDDIGPLGQRYTLEPVDTEHSENLFVIQPCNESKDLVRELQRIGTTALDISKGSYHVVCYVNQEQADKTAVQVIISLCHSLSDGPGALRVARSFLGYLGDTLDAGAGTEASIDNMATQKTPQQLTDIQALLLGSDYAADQEAKPVFGGQDKFTAALASNQMVMNDATVLPPEAMQNLPSDKGFGGPTCIECVHFTLTAQETDALRKVCRQHGTSVQGAITSASIRTRAKLLSLSPPVEAAVQIPVNTRPLANVDADECLCGSAGVWHLARLPLDEDLFALAKKCTESVRATLKDGIQPLEWLRRLFHAPATLPPYSLMVSSIGVAPIEPVYGTVEVSQLFFFGGALQTESPSQAQSTMVHAVTFRGELTCMINYTSPGVSKRFVNDTAILLKEALLSMITSR